jgi:hypothetical protein
MFISYALGTWKSAEAYQYEHAGAEKQKVPVINNEGFAYLVARGGIESG